MVTIVRIASVCAFPVIIGLVLSEGPAYAWAGASQSGRVVSQHQDTVPQDTVPQEDEDAKTGRKAPLEVFSDIEKAWNGKDVEAILGHFGRQKVWISVEGPGPSGGEFSRNQSYYLLKDLFKYTITRKFEFVQYRKPDDDGRTSFAVAERHFQRTDDGRLFKDKIYVSLHLENEAEKERWVVDEIKSIR